MYTLKTMVGVSPRGLLVSPAFRGSASDHQIIESSELLDGCFMPDDAIMADSGTLIQDLFATQDVAVNAPTTLRGINQLPAKTVVKDC